MKWICKNILQLGTYRRYVKPEFLDDDRIVQPSAQSRLGGQFEKR